MTPPKAVVVCLETCPSPGYLGVGHWFFDSDGVELDDIHSHRASWLVVGGYYGGALFLLSGSDKSIVRWDDDGTLPTG